MKSINVANVRRKANKCITLVLVLCMLLSSFSFTVSNALDAATKDFTAPKTAAAVNIDGIPNEAGWQINQQLVEGITASTNNTAAFGTMWDDSYLYVAFNVVDANVINSGAECPWDDDSVEVYIDGDNSKSYNTHTAQYIFRWNDSIVHTYSGARATGVLQKAVATAEGYTMEIAIPWSSIGGMSVPVGGSIIGITAHVNDKDVDDASELASDCIGYTTDLGNDWQNATNWAAMTLDGQAPPVTGNFMAGYAANGVTVDGIANEAEWKVSQDIVEGITEATNNSAKFGTLWDENNLYISFNVADTNVINSGAECPWDDDSVEVYIDGDNSKTYSSHTAQFIFRWNDNSVYNFGSSSKTGIVHKAVATADGYTMEIAIPWSCIGGMTAPSGGSKVGLTVHVNDKDVNDASQLASDCIGYTTNLGNDWQNASNWAEMTLENPPVPVATKLTYDFHKLGIGTQETQAGWSVKEKYDAALALSEQGYGVQVENDASNGWITFNFDVPVAGYYQINFNGALAGGGGLTNIEVDGNTLGQYDFFSSEYVANGGVKDLGIINLTAGTHVLKLQATGEANGAWSYRMYPSYFVLTPSAPVPQKLTYDFHKLGVDTQETQAGWSVKDKYDVALALSAQGYGVQVENDASNGWITFNFDVAAAGSYQVGFSGALAGGGGITSIIVDGKTLGQYDFYSADYVAAGSSKDLGIVNLTAGTHELKLQATGESNGAWSYRMYPSYFVLTPSQPAKQTFDFHKLGVDGQETQDGWSIKDKYDAALALSAQGYGVQVENDAYNGWITFNFDVAGAGQYQVDFSGALAGGGGLTNIVIDGVTVGQYDFYSADYVANGGSKTLGVVTLTAGTHELKLQATGESNGAWSYRMYPSYFVITPNTTGPSEYNYDFKKLGVIMNDGKTYQDIQDGWRIVPGDSNIGSSSYCGESYGFHVENYSTDNYITFEFDLPEAHIYQIGLSSALAAGGGIVDVKLDGNTIGQYDFFSGNFVSKTPNSVIKTLNLTKGLHKLTFKAIGNTYPSWGLCMYPGMLTLKKVDALPALTGLIMRANSTTLVKGQTTSIILKGTLSDGTQSGLADAQEKTFTSDNEAAVTVSDTGVITAVAPGTANITAHVSLDGVVMEKTVTVIVTNDVLQSVKLVPEKTTLVENTDCALTINALLSNGKPVSLNDAVVDITSDNQEVIQATADTIYAIAPGEANLSITLTLGEVTKTDSIKLTVVKKALSSVELTAADNINDILVGKTKQLAISGTYNDDTAVNFTNDGATVTYSSLVPDIADVDPNTGLVTAKAEGTAVIKVDVTEDEVTVSDTLALTTYTWANANNKKTRSSLYTPEKITNARNNISKYEWAKADKDAAVAEANQYLALGEDYWWNIVTSQNVPRSYSVNEQMKCPICGTDIYAEYGNYPWKIDPVNHPWKLICPNCQSLFPSNDFESYYKSGLDANGEFNPDLADKSLLKNTLYPDKPENWGVDDGYGAYADDKSQKLLFVAYYNHWGLWYDNQGYGIIQSALDAFRNAYLYTGEEKYAHMGTILLDRIADIYPSMDSSVYKWADGYRNSHGGTGLGKVLGSIWETLLVPSFIRAYDAFYPGMDDPATIDFLKNKAAEYGLENTKVSVSAIRKNIEDGILRQVLPGVKNCQLEGNTGMEQSCIALAAVVFDSLPETKELIDFNFKTRERLYSPDRVTGGDLLSILVDDVDRDGQGNECAPGYNYLWLEQLRQVADVMDGYTLEGLVATADLYKNPKFIKMFKAFYPLILSGRYSAAIGDTGGTGTAGLQANLEDCIKGFEKTGDITLAQLAYYMNHNSVDGLHSDIFSADPYKVVTDIQNIINTNGELKLNSSNMTGFGFAALRDGTNYIKDAGILYNFKDMPITKNGADFGYYSSSGTMQFNAMDPNLTAEFSFNVAAEDDYEIDLKTFKAGSYGIYDILIDGQKLVTYDFYGSSGAGNLEKIGNMHLTAGNHVVTFVNNGRNANNTEAYKFGVISMSLLNTEAQAVKKTSEEKGDTQRDAWMYYGSNNGHGHQDTLELGMHAFGIDVAPELGYPEYTGPDPKRLQWESNTISHNTVVVDNSKQQIHSGGTPLHFDDSDMVKIMDAEASGAYGQTSTYRRTTALIKVDDNNSYAIDLFKIIGGTDHNFSFHSNEGTVTTEGLNLTAQATGTYAGEDIAYAQRYDSIDGWGYTGSGYHYLKNVERDKAPASQFSVDWKIDPSRSPLAFQQDVHLKLTMLTQADDVALADGVPPQRPGNPETLKYLVVHRNGADLSSLFTSILQPYKDTPFIKSIEKVELKNGSTVVNDDSAAAVKVVLNTGRTDYLVYSTDTSITYTVDGKFQFKGFFGVYSEKDGKQIYGYVNDGTKIGEVTAAGNVTGTVNSFTKELSSNNEIIAKLDSSVNAADLTGRYIYVDNDGVRNASYEIKNAAKLQDGSYKLNIGDVTFIRKYADDNDFSKGYIYDIAEGQKLSIPLSVGAAPSEGPVVIPTITPTPEPTVTPTPEPQFSDIEGNWAHKAIMDMAKAGVLTGYSDGTARPNANATRAEFVTFITKLMKAESNASVDFSDIDSSAWYMKYLSAAVDKGWIKGRTDGSFAPNDSITREEAFVIISRVIDSLGVTATVDLSVLDAYKDKDSISEWAKNDMAKLAGLGIIQGSNGGLNPKAEITRAEICTILDRIMEKYLNK